MVLLIFFAFLAGIVTVLSPCILPILPIVLSGSLGSSRLRPFGIVIGFVLSFTVFTLSLATIVKSTGLSADFLRNFSVIIILGFGLSLLVPKFQLWMSLLFNKLSAFGPKQNLNSGFFGGLVLGFGLGLVWTPCVGPIIASVITLAATSNVSFGAVLITLAYSLGTAIPMFLIIRGGSHALSRIPWLVANTEKIQKIFGVLMIVVAIAIFYSLDRKFQTFVLNVFPQYGTGLTKIEDNKLVNGALDTLRNPSLTLPGGDQKAPEFIAGGSWFNSNPLTLASLKGKVVLVDFWTYTCINCIRTLPYTKSWYEKYHNQGFEIVGVHTPEFEFEKNSDNVKKAIADFNIKYPVMQDNDYATWLAYNNHYWPAEYLIDATGKIRHTHFGEGEYDQTEKAIQDLLKEAGQNPNNSLVNIQNQIPTAQISPETYIGSKRAENYYPDGSTQNGDRTFTLNEKTPGNSFSLGGQWIIEDDNGLTGTSSSLVYNFYASKVFLVLNPGSSGKAVVKVYLDGKVVDPSLAGVDVKDGLVNIIEDRLYNLIDLKGKTENHLLKLEFQTPGTKVFAFTFG